MPSPSINIAASLIFLLATLFGHHQISGKEEKAKLKVLIYSPSLSWSHMQFLGKMADILVEEGHQVHYMKILANPVLSARNETKLAHKVHRIVPKFVSADEMDVSKLGLCTDPFSGDNFYTLTAVQDSPIKQLKGVWIHSCREIVQNERLLADLAEEHFDVAIAEMYDACSFAFFHRIGVKTKLGAVALPLIQPVARNLGIPTFSSFVPNFTPSSINGPLMNFWERLANFYNDFYQYVVEDDIVNVAQAPIVEAAFGADYLPLRQHLKHLSMVFVNSDPFLEFPRPISNKIVHVGGLVDSKVGNLDQTTQRILDHSKRGVVLVSFGSLADTEKMPPKMRQAMVAAFGQFPEYDFIWKLDNQTRDNESALIASAPNVHIFDWVQQTAILKHPKLVAFVSHCGQNSLSEAARAGVPIVAIPLFGDQLYNAVLAKYKGMAVYLNTKKLNGGEAKESMVHALEKVLNDPAFRRNALLVGHKISQSPFSAREKLVRWVEFAAQFPNLDELNLPWDEEIHWFVYYSLDVLLFSAILLTFVALIVGIALAGTFLFVWRIFALTNGKIGWNKLMVKKKAA